MDWDKVEELLDELQEDFIKLEQHYEKRRSERILPHLQVIQARVIKAKRELDGDQKE